MSLSFPPKLPNVPVSCCILLFLSPKNLASSATPSSHFNLHLLLYHLPSTVATSVFLAVFCSPNHITWLAHFLFSLLFHILLFMLSYFLFFTLVFPFWFSCPFLISPPSYAPFSFSTFPLFNDAEILQVSKTPEELSSIIEGVVCQVLLG